MKPKISMPNSSPIRAALLARGETFTSIAAALGVSKNHVRHVALGLRQSPRVSAAIAEILKRPAAQIPEVA